MRSLWQRMLRYAHGPRSLESSLMRADLAVVERAFLAAVGSIPDFWTDGIAQRQVEGHVAWRRAEASR